MKGRGKINRTTILSFGMASFLLGLGLASRISFGFSLSVLFWILIFAPLLCFQNKLSLLSIIVIGLLLGLSRGSAFKRQLIPYHLYEKQKIIVSGFATSDAVYGDRSQLEFDIDKVTIQSVYDSSKKLNPKGVRLPGKIGAKGFGEAMVYRGDKVLVEAKLYPSKGSRQARMSFAKIKVIKRSDSTFNRFVSKFNTSLQNVFPEPLASLAQGILIGQRSNLPDNLNQDMQKVGLTHIVAVSGYNLTIIVQLVRVLLKGKSKYQSLVLMILLIGSFVAVTGLSASIVRASIVSLLSLAAWYYGREFKPWVLILLAASLTAGYFPAFLWSDIGWYLSFLAFTGVLILAPGYSRRFSKQQDPKIIQQLIIETSAAMVMTIPLILFVFGRISMIGLLANLLVIPLIPMAMLFSFAAGLLFMIWPSLGLWISGLGKTILTYIVDIISALARLSIAERQLTINFGQMIFIYLVILLTVVIWWKKSPQNVKIG